jgi:hypothetical protein
MQPIPLMTRSPRQQACVARHNVGTVTNAARAEEWEVQRMRGGRMVTSISLVVALVAGACSGDAPDDADTPVDVASLLAAACSRVEPGALPPGTVGSFAKLGPDEQASLVATYERAADDAGALRDTLGTLDGPSAFEDAVEILRVESALFDSAVAAIGEDGFAGAAIAAARLRVAGNRIAGDLVVDDCQDRLGLWTPDPPTAGSSLRPSLDCFDDGSLLATLARGGVGDTTTQPIEPVDCSMPHDLEAFVTFEAIPLLGQEYPGEVTLAEQAAVQCATTWELAVRPNENPGASTFSASFPSEAQWEDEPRSMTCLRFDPSGERLEANDPATSSTAPKR